jgi:hypothetical protein
MIVIVRTVRSILPTPFLFGTTEPLFRTLLISLKITFELGCRRFGKRSRYSLSAALAFQS